MDYLHEDVPFNIRSEDIQPLFHSINSSCHNANALSLGDLKADQYNCERESWDAAEAGKVVCVHLIWRKGGVPYAWDGPVVSGKPAAGASSKSAKGQGKQPNGKNNTKGKSSKRRSQGEGGDTTKGSSGLGGANNDQDEDGSGNILPGRRKSDDEEDDDGSSDENGSDEDQGARYLFVSFCAKKHEIDPLPRKKAWVRIDSPYCNNTQVGNIVF
ncbi:hypothetical protein MRB53_041273 [Persea americana]|nr:hypothetical protein MRB53_041273 [Persea americana]